MMIIEKNFGSLSNAKSKGRGKNGDVLAEKKGNFIMINWFKYDETWKFLPSLLSLSLYSTYKIPMTVLCFRNISGTFRITYNKHP